MHFEIITLFPEMFDAAFGSSIIGRALKEGHFTERRIALRDYALNKHGQVDDYPYGGGPGMVLRPEPATAALKEARERCAGQKTRVLLFSPQGVPLTQARVREYAASWDSFVLFCAHYKGLDERVAERYVDEEISIGDYVLTGGELPAMVFIDAVVRMREGVVGNFQSVENDSFSGSLLEHPLYTRPEVFEGVPVPPVLLSGNHRDIEEWTLRESLRRTVARRPDLINEQSLSQREKNVLNAIKGATV